MPQLGLDPYPAALPEIRVLPLSSTATVEAIECNELQWWFIVPLAGETSRAAWYDRDTGALTRVRETAHPVVDTAAQDGTVLIDIDEWSCSPGDHASSERITMTATLTADQAEFRSVTMGGDSVRLGDAEFEANWTGVGPRRITTGHFERIGDRRYRTTRAQGVGLELVDLDIADRSFRCLRVLDLPSTTEDEIGQPLIDLETGRTVAYWQYRPAAWDEDAADWLRQHPGLDITIDDVTFQRRNCTGRDEVAITDIGLGLAAP